ncbi:hypothetical protein FRZ44_37870 [Hypericibacter terrae]|uniref:Uncharacterized protein n=1 Tax=Hypericibacter terrae TaxID=2602015 RepID=A0A5J6MQZ5_9PROT|nr:phage tail protein [Hypericibacter terrae]QEX18480.1 hypothetical protein FRZ44_37870 [Hypericibacter terrae]
MPVMQGRGDRISAPGADAIVRGRKGGGKAAGGTVYTPREDPNSLRSKSVVRLTDLLCEGPVVGPLNDSQSILLEDTKLQAVDGSYNFQGITWEFRTGTTDQAPFTGDPALESEQVVGVEVKFDTPITRTITNPDLDAVRVTIRLSALFEQKTNGDLVGSEVEHLIEWRDNGGPWIRSTTNLKWEAFDDTTLDTASGLQVTVQATTAGGAKTQTVDVAAEYRAVGDVSWTALGSKTVTVLNATRRAGGARDDVVAAFLPTAGSATFEIAGLSEDEYEVRATVGTVVAKLGLVPQGAVITGKTMSPYEISYRIDITGTGPWDIRVSRLTPDSDSAQVQNAGFWSRYTEIIDDRLIYPDSALIKYTVDAEQFGDQVPSRGVEGKWLIMEVPANYDPEARTYDGIWDGTFQMAWTNNPAWFLYALLTNTRWGCGIPAENVDKWALYEIGVYNDELVPDGFGGTEPRFTFNGLLNTGEEAYRVIQAVASNCRCMVFWASGTVTVVQDRPRDVERLITPANVIGGRFDWQGTALKARHTYAAVTWNDPGDGYRAAIEPVEDDDGIATLGLRQVDVLAYGSTSQGQSHRAGLWVLETEKSEGELCTWRAGWDQADLTPGMLVAVADPVISGVRYGGRVKSGSTDSAITLDAAVTLFADQTYTLSVVMADNAPEDRDVTTGAGDTDTIEVDPPFSAAPASGAVWVLTSSDIKPIPINILSLREIEQDQVEITGNRHDPTKYDRIELGLVLDPPPTSILGLPPRLPSDMALQESLYSAGPSVRAAVTVSWKDGGDGRSQFYELQAKRPGQQYQIANERIQGTSLQILDTEPGLWSFRVRAISNIGQRSGWLERRDVYLTGTMGPLDDVAGFSIQALNAEAHLTWIAGVNLNRTHYELRFSPVTVAADWGSASVLIEQIGRDATSVNAPLLVGSYLIKAVGDGLESANATLIVSTVAGIDLTATETATEETAFAGSGTNTQVIADQLTLADGETSGTYVFANAIDLGGVYRARLIAHVKAFGESLNNLIDDWTDVDAITNWDGADPSQWRIRLEIRLTLDDPGGTPTWGDWLPFTVGDYLFWGAEFRAQLESLDAGVRPVAEELSVTATLPLDTAHAEDVVSNAAGDTITYASPFHTSPSVGINAQDMATGDYYAITSKSRTGFSIRFFNSAGTGISRTYDWIAVGRGQEQ